MTGAPLPVSVLLLARDETGEIEALLPTLAFAREIVVVWDAAGDPETRAAAERLGARVFTRKLDGFGAQRQFALEQCREEWVLWIDSDERLGPGSVEAMEDFIEKPGTTGPAYARTLRAPYFLGRFIRFCGWSNEILPRFFTRKGARFDDAIVHERLVTDDMTVIAASYDEIWFEHHSYPDWDTCVSKLVRYAEANAEKAARAGRRAGPLDVLARPPLRFFRQYVLQLGFLDGVHGLVLCSLAAWQVGLKYAGLWARSRGTRDGGRADSAGP